MKLDKDTLVKEHFWFLLGLLVVMVLLSLVLLWTTTGGAIAKEKKTFEDQKRNLEGIPKSGPKNINWISRQDDKLKKEGAQKDRIWGEAWKVQFIKEDSRFMTWPPTLQPEDLDFLNKLYFGDPIDDTIRNHYGTAYFNKNRPAESQLVQAIELVQPGVVQFLNPWHTTIRWVQEWKSEPPTAEDIWLAQEDMWVQTGLLKIIATTNDLLAKMKEDKAMDERYKDARHRVFTNVNWSLDLDVSQAIEGKPVFQYKLTNIGRRRQILPIKFQITFTGLAQPTELEVTGEPLTPGKSIAGPKEGKPIPVQFGSPKGIAEVKQLFDWRTVPIKRIDQLQMGVNSVRTTGLPLKPPEGGVFKKDTPDASQSTQSSDTTRGGKLGTITSASGGNVAGGNVAGSSSTDSKTVNGLERNRYLEVSPQVRRMPVGLALVVDQAHIQDVLTAVANSALRIQSTQWHWRRFHGDIKPKEEESPTTPAPATEAPPPVRSSAGKLIGLNPRLSGPSGPMTPAAGATSGGEEQQDWDLVELAIYGIASLYERYPPRDKAASAGAATTTGAPTAPASGGPTGAKAPAK
jgi:hypothetical protein